MKNKLVAIIHLLFIILAYSSPFWLDWKLIALGISLYIIQIIFFKTCILSYIQFENKNISFVGIGIEKFLGILNIKIKHSNIRLFLNYLLPILILLMAYILQN